VLLREQLIFEDELARTLSVQLSIPYIGIKQIGVNPYVARLLPADVGEAVAAIPVRDGTKSVQVVFADPTDPRALDAVRRHLPEIEVAVAELSDIRLAWRTIAGERESAARIVSCGREGPAEPRGTGGRSLRSARTPAPRRGRRRSHRAARRS
jgi:hypothetical protein